MFQYIYSNHIGCDKHICYEFFFRIFVGAPEFEENGGKGGGLFECVVDGSSCTAQSIESR